jgi:Protein-tyrosine phosphatase
MSQRPPQPQVYPRPHANTYWVFPGRLLAGEYPGAPDPHDTKAKLWAFLDCKVDSFVDLTHEDELVPYAGLLNELASERGVVVRHCRIPIRDMAIPASEGHMSKILDQIDKWLDARRVVYVHCWGGVGRTGTVIGCHLVRTGLSSKEALARLAELWLSVSEGKRRRHPQSPQTSAQVSYIRNWPYGR